MFYTKEITIDYLYLDLNTCARCVGTDEVLEGVLDVFITALQPAEDKVVRRKTEMSTADIALNISFYHPRLFVLTGRISALQ